MNKLSLSVLSVTLIAMVGGYSFWLEPNWIDVSFHDLRSTKVAGSIRIVQLSDLHLQDITQREIDVADKVKALKPDVVILSGDVIDTQDRLPSLHTFLTALAATPTVAVLGNWEYWANVDLSALRREYEHHGIPLLVNEVASLQVRLKTLHLVGMDDFTAGKPDAALLAAPPGPGTAVLVEHSPGYFEHLPMQNSRKFSLCLSGHTHGGQITLFGWAVWTPPGSGRFSSGFYETGACRLYVSKGVGMSLLPARLGARPEIAVFDL